MTKQEQDISNAAEQAGRMIMYNFYEDNKVDLNEKLKVLMLEMKEISDNLEFVKFNKSSREAPEAFRRIKEIDLEIKKIVNYLDKEYGLDVLVSCGY